MTEFGVDLSEWLESGRVRALLDLVDQLPSACRLYEAAANDPEQAEVLALHRLENRDSKGGTWSPRLSEFNLQAHMLRDVIHELKALRRVTISAHGGKPGEDKPFPSPRTAVDVAFEQLEDALASDLLSRFGFDDSDI